MRTVATLALLAVGASLSFGQNPAGTWKGKVNVKLRPSASAETRARFNENKDKLAKLVIHLVVKANKTWTLKATGTPAGPNGNTQTGTWTQTGRTITLKSDPVPNTKFTPPPQNLTLSADGKTMTMTIPIPDPNVEGTVVYKR